MADQRETPQKRRSVQRSEVKQQEDPALTPASQASDVHRVPHHIVGLQRVIGNQAVQRMLTRANTGTLSTLQRVKEGVDYVHSEHSKERMSERNISQTQLEKTLDNPDKINPGNKSGTSEYLSQLPSGMILKAVVSNDNPKTVITVIKMRKHKDFK